MSLGIDFFTFYQKLTNKLSLGLSQADQLSVTVAQSPITLRNILIFF